MSKRFLLFCFSIVLFGCKEPEYKYYHSQLYPIKNWGDTWEKTAHFKDIPISICLESRIDVEDYPTIYVGRFEPILINTANLSFDREIILLGDTFQTNRNLLETKYAKIELLVGMVNGNYMLERYLIWINKDNIADCYTSKGYFTVYFKAKTENNYIINDSTVICIQ